MNDYSSFLELIAGDKERMVGQLVKWASINSGSYNDEGLRRMRSALIEDFGVLGGEMEAVYLGGDVDDSPRALRMVRRPEAPVQVLFNGHMDTVYGVDHGFQLCTRVNENVLEGPGVADMKGGLVVMLEVLKVFERSEWAKNIGWEVLIVPDEEIGSRSSLPLLEGAVKRHTLGLIFEPSLPDGSLVRSRKGTGVLTVMAHGKARHVGRDFNREDNAIVGLCSFASKVDALNAEFPGAIFNVGRIEGGGAINIVPDYAVAKIDFRVNSVAQRDSIEARLRALVDAFNKEHKVQVEVALQVTRPPKPPTEGGDVLFREFEACGKALGMVLGFQDTGGASDGSNLAAAGLPNIDNLGVCGGGIHTDKEYVFLESLVQRAQLTVLFLLKLASREIVLPERLFPNQKKFL